MAWRNGTMTGRSLRSTSFRFRFSRAEGDPGGHGLFLFTVQPGEAMGLVGESGCGKSTVALGVMQDLGVNGRIVGGLDQVQGARSGAEMSAEELRDIRGSEIAMIYQEPMASPEPGDEDRQAADGSADDPSGDRAKRRTPMKRALQVVDGCEAAGPEADAGELSRTSFRGPAAADRHRDGADVGAVAADPGRADHGAGRDGRGGGGRTGQGAGRRSTGPRCCSSRTIWGWCWRPATGSA